MKLSRQLFIIGAGLAGLTALVHILVALQAEMSQNNPVTLTLAALTSGIILGGILIWFLLHLNRSSVDLAAYRQTQAALQDKIQALQTIAEIEQALGSTATLADKTAVLLQRTIAYLHVDLGCISLIEPQTQIVKVAALQGAHNADQLRAAPMRVGQGATGWVAEKGEPIAIVDVAHDARWVHTSATEAEGIVSFLGVPLCAGERPIGVIELTTRTRRAFTQTEIDFLQTLAGQAAIAIENARLHDALQQRVDEFRALYEMTQDLSTAQDLDALLQTITDRAIALLQAPAGGMYLYDTVRQDLTAVVTTHPSTPIGMRLNLGEGMAGRVAQTREPLIVDDYRTWEGRATKFGNTSLTAVLEVPMLYRGELIGVLVVEEIDATSRRFNEEDARLLSLFASSAAGLVHTARLLADTQQRAAELEILRQASLQLTSQLDLTAVLDAILENTLRIAAESQNTHIYFYQDQRLNFAASLWTDGRKGQQWAEPRANGLTYTVAQQGEMIVVPDMRQHPLFEQTSFSNTGAIIGLPLKVENLVIGVMNVAYAQPHLFSPAELRVLELLADQAASAIANAHLHQAIQHSEERYRSLVENIPIGVYRVTPGAAGRLLMSNPAHLKMFGYASLAEFQKINISDLYFEPAERKIFSDLLLEKGALAEYRQHLKKKDGTPIWVLVTARAIYQNNQPAYFDCTAIDITARQTETLARAQAEDTLRQRTRELEALLQVANSATNLDMETVLTEVAHQAREMLHATEVSLFLMDDQSALLRPIVALGDYRTERLAFTLRLGEGIVGWVAQQRQAIIIDHGITDPRLKHVPGTPWEDESFMLAPMLRGDQVLGVIMLNRIPATGFAKNELDLLIGMAAQAAAAIANAHLFAETRRNALEQRIVSEITRALNASLDVNKTFPLVVKGIRALADCDRISLALLDPDNRHFTMVILDEPRPELAQGTRLPIYATACADDILANKEHLTPDLLLEAGHPAERLLYESGYRSRVNLPLVVGDHSIGALNLVSRRVGAYSPAQLGPLKQIANTIAIALENSHLFRAELTRREELSALYSLSRQLADINNSETVLQLVAQHVVQTVRVTFARILLVEVAELVVRAVYPIRNLDNDLLVGQRVSLARCAVCRQALEQATPLELQANDPSLSDWERQTLFLDVAHNVCLVPLQVGKRPIGLLMLGEVRREEREPFTPDKIRLARNIADQAASALHRVELFAELESAYLQTVLALANAVDAKDSDTHTHSQRLSTWAFEIGRRMGLDARALEDLRYGTILHDIGKIGVPDAILKKPAPLNADEWTKMHQHPAIGAKIMEPLPRLAGAATIVRHHHERYDGAGYPDGLAGEAIPLGARILAVVDAYGAIIDKRVYKDGRSPEQARQELRQCAGAQFDPQIVDLFLKFIAPAVPAEAAP